MKLIYFIAYPFASDIKELTKLFTLFEEIIENSELSLNAAD